MPTLDDIQDEVNEALKKIKAADRESVQEEHWPNIKDMLIDCTDLDEFYRGQMRKLIYERLNNQPLHGAPVPINLQNLKGALIRGNIHVPEPTDIIDGWLVW
ncbi:MAG TPA: hypothetical protein VJO32_13800 [Ktedonobacteraceae bacterium]|nr:hypothetical protein [Ktedonobacteraceae bacterium]